MHWCATCQSEGIATPADSFCQPCGKHRCAEHAKSDPHYVPPVVDDRTLDLDFGPAVTL